MISGGVFGSFGGDTDALNAAVQAKIDLYNSHGVALDTNGAKSEIVADFTKDFLYGENSINRIVV